MAPDSSRTCSTTSACRGLALLLLAGLASCASPGVPAPLGQPLALSPGEQVTLPDATLLRYLGVSADSRCPPAAQCVRAGDADVAIAFTIAGSPTRSTVINTRSPEAAIGCWRLRLLSLESGKRPRLTLQIEERKP